MKERAQSGQRSADTQPERYISDLAYAGIREEPLYVRLPEGNYAGYNHRQDRESYQYRRYRRGHSQNIEQYTGEGVYAEHFYRYAGKHRRNWRGRGRVGVRQPGVEWK